MYFENSSGYKIYYEDSGEKELTPVVFLHAWGSSHRDFQYSFDNIEGFRRIIYDHRGFGKSDRPERDMSLKHLACDLKELIEFLELKDVVLVGYSMGASTLYKYFEMFGQENIKSAVICDMTPRILNGDGWKYGIMSGEFGTEDLLESLKEQFEDMNTAYYHLYTRTDKELLNKKERVVRRAVEADLAGNSYYSITSMWFSVCYEDFRESVKNIDIPVALFFASPGSLVNPETVKYLEENIKDTYTHIFENSTHGFVNNRPRYFKEQLELFLKTLQNR